MKNIFKKLRKSALLYTVIYICILITTDYILNIFNMNYREWVLILSFILIVIGFIVSIIQFICKINNKIIKIVTSIVFIIILMPCAFYTFMFCSIGYEEEHVVIKDDKKMVAYVHNFMETYVRYYDYKSFLTKGAEPRIEEYYGNGGFDPIENNHPVISVKYYDENGNVINTVNNINEKVDEKPDNSKNELQDITDKVLNGESYFSGIVNNIDENNIYFSDNKYCINKNNFNYINGRTNEEMNTNDVKVGYYIDTNTYSRANVISILSNIKGEQLRQELMKNFSLEKPIYTTVSPVGTNMEIINKNKAILTITFDDLLPNYNVDSGKFEMKVEINSNTVIECKGGINNIEQLQNVTLDIIKIKLDKNTINNKIPVATYFMSSNGN